MTFLLLRNKVAVLNSWSQETYILGPLSLSHITISLVFDRFDLDGMLNVDEATWSSSSCCSCNLKAEQAPERAHAELQFLRLFRIQGTLLVYGGERHNVFLGCPNCEPSHRDSIDNKNGEHGSLTGE
jgi:hypothetical protein